MRLTQNLNRKKNKNYNNSKEIVLTKKITYNSMIFP